MKDGEEIFTEYVIEELRSRHGIPLGEWHHFENVLRDAQIDLGSKDEKPPSKRR